MGYFAALIGGASAAREEAVKGTATALEEPAEVLFALDARLAVANGPFDKLHVVNLAHAFRNIA